MAEGGEKVAKEKEERPSLLVQEKLKTLESKLDLTSKFKLITKDEYDDLMALKASTPEMIRQGILLTTLCLDGTLAWQ